MLSKFPPSPLPDSPCPPSPPPDRSSLQPSIPPSSTLLSCPPPVWTYSRVFQADATLPPTPNTGTSPSVFKASLRRSRITKTLGISAQDCWGQPASFPLVKKSSTVSSVRHTYSYMYSHRRLYNSGSRDMTNYQRSLSKDSKLQGYILPGLTSHFIHYTTYIHTVMQTCILTWNDISFHTRHILTRNDTSFHTLHTTIFTLNIRHYTQQTFKYTP